MCFIGKLEAGTMRENALHLLTVLSLHVFLFRF